MVDEPENEEVTVFDVKPAVFIEKPEEADEYGMSVVARDNVDDCCENSSIVTLDNTLGLKVVFKSDTFSTELFSLVDGIDCSLDAARPTDPGPVGFGRSMAVTHIR